MPTEYQYNTDRKEAKTTAASTSLIGKGSAWDAGAARNTVVDKVKETLLNRMKNANEESKKAADSLAEKSNEIAERCNNELSSIASVEKTKKELRVKIFTKEAEKNAFEADADHKKREDEYRLSKKDYSKKKKAVSREKSMRHKQKGLTQKEAYVMAHGEALVSLQEQIETSWTGSRREKENARALYSEGLKEWEAEQEELTSDRRAVEEYKDSSKEHLTEDYYKRIKKEREDAKSRYENASADHKADQSRIKAMTDEIVQDNARLLDVLYGQSKKKSALLNDASNSLDLTRRYMEHQVKSAEYSRQHDKAAMQYYILARGKSAKKSDNVKIPNHNKDISKYIGYVDFSPTSLSLLFQEIESNPQSPPKISVQNLNLTDAGNPAGDDHIVHDKMISLTEGGKTYHMDSEFTIHPDASSGSAASGANAPSTPPQPQKLKDLTELSINKTDATEKHYISTAETLMLQTVATGGLMHKQEVSGLWINGEFIPADDSHYKSAADARKGDQKKMTADGAFNQDEQLSLAIRNSDFFRHIYAENIERYTRYPGDDGIDAVALREADPSGAAPSLAVVKNIYKTANEDDKALTLFQYRKNTNFFEDLLTDNDLYANAPKNKVVAKLVHAMLALNKDRQQAIQFARDYGSKELSQIAGKATEKDYFTLFAACSTVIQGESISGAFKKFKSGTMDFLDGDSPFFKGTFAEGMIDYDQANDTYNALNEMYGFASGKIQKIQDLEDEMAEKVKGSPEYLQLEKKKEAAESDLEHGVGGDILKLVTNAKDIILSIKNIIEMKKDGRLLSEDNAAEKDLGGRYVCWIDYIFDIGNAILTPLNALVGILANGIGIVKVKSAKPVLEIVSIIKDIFGTIESGYHIIQNSRKFSNITESMDTITSDASLRDASKKNPQVMYYLGRTRNKAGKDIAESSLDFTTGAANSVGDFLGTAGSKIIHITTSAISTLGKMITNGIYNGKEKTAALRAAFDNKYTDFKKNPNFDRILKMTAGINSLKHLAVVSRIFAAIDTHHLLKAAPSGSFEFKLAKTAMSAFYKPKQIGIDATKEGFDILPLSAILKHVGEGDDWRGKLAAAIR